MKKNKTTTKKNLFVVVAGACMVILMAMSTLVVAPLGDLAGDWPGSEPAKVLGVLTLILFVSYIATLAKLGIFKRG